MRSQNPRRANLERLLNPRSIVFVGGRGVEIAIQATRGLGFGGALWAVHPTRPNIAGVECCASLAKLPGTPDAAFLAVRAETCVAAIGELRALGCAGAVCHAAGFGEAGRPDLEEALRRAAGDMALLGPNCYGVLNYLDGAALWADFHGGSRVDRGAAFVSQSGNLSLILTMASRGLPLSVLVSTGNQAVLEVTDFIDVLIDDPRVSCIGLYLEGLRDLPRFWRCAARALERGVPIVAFKAGTSELGRELIRSHTGSPAGSDAQYQTMFDRLGIARVDSIPELCETLKLHCISSPLEGRKLGVLTCSGADSAMIADRADALGIELPPLTAEQVANLRDYAADFVSLTNPLDFNTQIWADPKLHLRCCEDMLKGGQYDAVALVHDFPAAGRSDLTAWASVCDAFVDAHRRIGGPAVILSNFGTMIPEQTHRQICSSGVTPLDGLREGMAAIRHAGWYGEQRARLLAGRLAPESP